MSHQCDFSLIAYISINFTHVWTLSFEITRGGLGFYWGSHGYHCISPRTKQATCRTNNTQVSGREQRSERHEAK